MKATDCCTGSQAARSRFSLSGATQPIRMMLSLTRERVATPPELTSKMADATTGYVHIIEFSKRSPVLIQAGGRRAGKNGRDSVRRRPARRDAWRSR